MELFYLDHFSDFEHLISIVCETENVNEQSYILLIMWHLRFCMHSPTCTDIHLCMSCFHGHQSGSIKINF